MSFQEIAAALSCTLVGSVTLVCGLYQRLKLRRVEAWPQVIGNIRKAEIIHDTGSDSSGYFVLVHYDYSVNDANYHGSRVGFRRRAYLRKKNAQAVVDRYPPNTTAPVFYDPEKPSEAVLVPEYPDNVLLIVCGIGLLILVVIILVAHA